jgi:hypothetical protein
MKSRHAGLNFWYIKSSSDSFKAAVTKTPVLLPLIDSGLRPALKKIHMKNINISPTHMKSFPFKIKNMSEKYGI